MTENAEIKTAQPTDGQSPEPLPLSMDAQKQSETPRNLKNIVLLGLVSLFVDMSTEMVYPIVPLFLLSIGAMPAIIGIIEGIAECVASLLKVFAGYFADKTGGNKKSIAFAGYLSAIIYKIGMLLSFHWVGVLISRLIDRTGKGVRTVPRDALVAESGGKKLGGSFGLHKFFDMLGSGLGVLLAYIILSSGFNLSNGSTFKTIFIISIIPALVGVSLLLLVKETKKPKIETKQKISFKNLKLDKRLMFYLGIIFLFSIANSSKVFMLLKAQENGFDDRTVLLLYLVFNLAASFLAVPFGKLSDKISRKALIIPAYLVFGLTYFGFAFLHSTAGMVALFFGFGLFTALITGAERGYIAEAAPKHLKSTVMGLAGMLQGIGLLIASTLAGVLWSFGNSNLPFYIGGSIAVVCAVLCGFVFIKKRQT